MPLSETLRFAVVFGFVVIAIALGGCGRGKPRPIAETRELSERERKVHLDASSAERFGEQSHAHGEAAAPAGGSPFRWEMPEGWEELEATSMRVANFRFGEGGVGECYLTALPGEGGGTAANLNRWREQMGLEPASEEEIAALPTIMFLGQPALYASLDGVFTGMGGAPQEGYRMLGTILNSEQFTLFVKMTGPADVVGGEEENFKRFCASLRIVSTGSGSNP